MGIRGFLAIVVLTALPIAAEATTIHHLDTGATGLTWRTERELVQVEAFGTDSVRVRFTNARGPINPDALARRNSAEHFFRSNAQPDPHSCALRFLDRARSSRRRSCAARHRHRRTPPPP